MKQNEDLIQTCPAKPWQKRLAVAAFLFFLIKGLLWLILPTAAALMYF